MIPVVHFVWATFFTDGHVPGSPVAVFDGGVAAALQFHFLFAKLLRSARIGARREEQLSLRRDGLSSPGFPAHAHLSITNS